jgi:hypothetical protein
MHGHLPVHRRLHVQLKAGRGVLHPAPARLANVRAEMHRACGRATLVSGGRPGGLGALRCCCWARRSRARRVLQRQHQPAGRGTGAADAARHAALLLLLLRQDSPGPRWAGAGAVPSPPPTEARPASAAAGAEAHLHRIQRRRSCLLVAAAQRLRREPGGRRRKAWAACGRVRRAARQAVSGARALGSGCRPMGKWRNVSP